MQQREDRLNKKGCPHINEGDREEEGEEEVMAIKMSQWWNLQSHRREQRRWWILPAVKPVKGWTGTMSFLLDSKSYHANISWRECLKGKIRVCI